MEGGEREGTQREGGGIRWHNLTDRSRRKKRKKGAMRHGRAWIKGSVQSLIALSLCM